MKDTNANREDLRKCMEAAMADLSCPDTDTLLAYSADPSAPGAQTIASHIKACARCQQLLNDAADFFEPARASDQTDSSPDLAREWERLQERLTPPRPVLVPPPNRPSLLQTYFPIAASLALTAAIAALLALRGQTNQLQDRLAAIEKENSILRDRDKGLQTAQNNPILNLEIRDLQPVTAATRTGGANALVRINAASGGALILNGVKTTPAAKRVQILSSGTGQMLWEGGPLERSADGSYVLLVRPKFAAPGVYRVKVLSSSDSQVLAEFEFGLE